MNLTQKQSLIAIAVLAIVCAFLGAKLYVNNQAYNKLTGEYGQLELSKEWGLLFRLAFSRLESVDLMR